MTSSYNGFKAGDPATFTPPGLDDSAVPGTTVHLEPGLHRGDIATVLLYVATQLHERVEPGVEGECWGYAYRPSKNDVNLISCHASGTAFDWNAPAHPNGKKGTFTKAKVTEIRKILAEVEGVVHWGGDGWGAGSTIDEMHFEIAEGVTMMQLAEVAAKLRAPAPAPAPQPAPKPAPAPAPAPVGEMAYGERSDRVRRLQEFMTRTFHAYNAYVPTGFYGDSTTAGLAEFQMRVGIRGGDGRNVGPQTAAALGRFGFNPYA